MKPLAPLILAALALASATAAAAPPLVEAARQERPRRPSSATAAPSLRSLVEAARQERLRRPSSATAAPSLRSLVEAARQERLRREALARRAGPDAPPPRVYTDADLVFSGRLTMRVGDDAPGAAAEAATPAAGPEAPPPPEAAADGGEQRWRDRMAAARQALERAERRAAELQTRANGLWADFTARDDPAQRAVIEQERQAALADLDATRAEAAERAQAVADLRDEARRAGVPPGWLR